MMETQPVVDWLIGWMRERSRLEGKLDFPTTVNYVDAGWVDSLGTIQLIAAAEARYGIRFNEGHMADPAFLTLAGLADLIVALQEAKLARPVPRGIR